MLTEVEVRQAKPTDKPKRLYDAGALYIEIRPSGSKLWRWKYRWQGRERLLALDAHPDVTLAAARDARDEARRKLRGGVDPSLVKRLVTARAASDSLQTVAQRWWEDARKHQVWTEDYARDVWRRLELHIFPELGTPSSLDGEQHHDSPDLQNRSQPIVGVFADSRHCFPRLPASRRIFTAISGLVPEGGVASKPRGSTGTREASDLSRDRLSGREVPPQ